MKIADIRFLAETAKTPKMLGILSQQFETALVTAVITK
jgi:hypothetical protein